MATKTRIIRTDDLDGTESADPDVIRAVSFEYDGVEYSIDLTDKNARKLERAFGPYIKAARRTGGRRQPGAKSNGSVAPAKRIKGAKVIQVESTPATIRAWARSNGIEVTGRGRISDEVRAAFAKANA